jgi:hypothetical protein
LAVSWFSVSYSRSGFPHTTATFFAYLAFYLYLLSPEKGSKVYLNKFVFLYGLSLGLAFTSHYSLFWLLAMFGIIEIIYFFKNLRKESFLALKRILLWSLAVIIPLAFWQGITLLIKFWIYSNASYIALVKGASGEGHFITYLAQLFKQVSAGNRQTGYKGNILFYLEIIFKKEGILFLFSLVAGLLCLLRDSIRKPYKINILIITLYFLIPFFLWGLYSHYPTTRTFSVALPAACAIIGFSFGWLYTRFKYLAVILLAPLIVGQLVNTIPLLSYKSGFKEAISYMRSHKGVEHLSSNPHISRVYVDKDEVCDMSFSFREKEKDPTGKLHISLARLEEFYKKKKFPYLLLDQFRYTNPNEIYKASIEVKPVFTAAHTTVAFFYDLRKRYQRQILRHSPIIEIYDLEEIIKTIERNQAER